MSEGVAKGGKRGPQSGDLFSSQGTLAGLLICGALQPDSGGCLDDLFIQSPGEYLADQREETIGSDRCCSRLLPDERLSIATRNEMLSACPPTGAADRH